MTMAANQTNASGVLRLLALCGAVLLVALAILIYVVSSNSSGVAGFERAEGVLFPDLGSQIDNVQSVEINNGRSRFVLTRRDEGRSEEHTSELQSLMRISYAVFCLKTKKRKHNHPK